MRRIDTDTGVVREGIAFETRNEAVWSSGRWRSRVINEQASGAKRLRVESEDTVSAKSTEYSSVADEVEKPPFLDAAVAAGGGDGERGGGGGGEVLFRHF